MADKVTKEETFVDSIHSFMYDWAVVQAVVEVMRTLGYLEEPEYSKMNTIIVQRSDTYVRHDRAETVDLARGQGPLPARITGMDLVQPKRIIEAKGPRDPKIYGSGPFTLQDDGPSIIRDANA